MLHLLLILASFVLAYYAGERLLRHRWLAVAVWFVGAAFAHDLVLLPLYSAGDAVLRRVTRNRFAGGGGRPGERRAVPAVSSGGGDVRGGSGAEGRHASGPAAAPHRARLNHLRVPAFLSLLLLLVWWPLVLERVPDFEAHTRLSPHGFAERWALLTAGLFALSGLWAAVAARSRRRRTASR
ncbi:hypothetical protein ACFV3R_07845 [Streptomyces sp. NPDC059740]|uniref:hypothetical protein n=1 Tax=Streptomyces sp. NPDC059740 TaxID=3346926 RepID=UPI00364611A3